MPSNLRIFRTGSQAGARATHLRETATRSSRMIVMRDTPSAIDLFNQEADPTVAQVLDLVDHLYRTQQLDLLTPHERREQVQRWIDSSKTLNEEMKSSGKGPSIEG